MHFQLPTMSSRDFRIWCGLLRRESSRIGMQTSLSIYGGFYDLFSINEKEKKGEYKVPISKSGTRGFCAQNWEAPKKKSNPVGIRALTKPESYGIISFLAVTG